MAALVFALLPSLVRAQHPCNHWNVTGQWGIKQSNQGVLNQLDLYEKKGSVIAGKASYDTGKGIMRGSLDGTIRDGFQVKSGLIDRSKGAPEYVNIPANFRYRSIGKMD